MEADRLFNKAYQEVLENNPVLIEKSSGHLATEEQIELLQNRGIRPEKYLSKIEAHRIIKNIKKNCD